MSHVPMEFPEDFNQLELLETHHHRIPVGSHSLWPDEEEDEEEEREGRCGEEWYQQQEQSMEARPGDLLLWAAERNRLATVQRLLTADASLVESRDEDGYTALHRAAYSGHLEVAQCLMHHGADLHARTVDGWTPLHSACRWNNAAVASYLIQQGAEVNAQTNGLLTPLHLAAGNSGARQTLELLLMQRQIQAQLKSSSGETALDVARRTSAHYRLFEIVEPCNNILP
ncbi:ankyrin repeat domain-containing protein 49 [Brienomyrus brachyistius]|uniref:ankyrin repeat domain-containing protein 49 n=1 Tax=Brienomyrus brachyistius TaxID=42636 RepID=UPI0020B1EE83|nr:ankyrin repeat domain-containing protein 49 [Brienomyrus brachyistius]XP_048838211.1 ankyrin repeat domain-containing protein 49 [Brienomyrus brachyistius]XP_048838212.1 ankyrin repeat domain-containing protein 49 [Brienomyrus brachyistius]